MEKQKKDNPLYSTTDDTKLTTGNDEWKKILPARFIILQEKKERKGRGPVSSRTLMKSELIIALLVAIHYLKAIPNLKVVVAGQVFMSLLAKAVSFILR